MSVLRHGMTALCAALLGLAASGTAHAAAGPISEVRLGVLDHDTSIAGGTEKGVDLNGEVIFVSFVPDDFLSSLPRYLQWVFHPREHVGVEINTAGATNSIYGGLTWNAVLATQIFTATDGLEFNYLFGPEVNDGHVSTKLKDRKALGSNVLFHLGFELAYRINPKVDVGVYFDHDSDGGLAKYNRSLNDLGLRVGYRF